MQIDSNLSHFPSGLFFFLSIQASLLLLSCSLLLALAGHFSRGQGEAATGAADGIFHGRSAF